MYQNAGQFSDKYIFFQFLCISKEIEFSSESKITQKDIIFSPIMHISNILHTGIKLYIISRLKHKHGKSTWLSLFPWPLYTHFTSTVLTVPHIDSTYRQFFYMLTIFIATVTHYMTPTVHYCCLLGLLWHLISRNSSNLVHYLHSRVLRQKGLHHFFDVFKDARDCM